MQWMAVAMVLSGIGGCGSETPTEYSVGSLNPPPPAGLGVLAAEIRGAGGFVFVGTIDSVSEGPDELVRDRPQPGLHVAYPILVGEVTVTDTLGASMSPNLVVQGLDGAPQIVDDAGEPDTSWAISGSTERDEHRWMPSNGEHLFFVMPQGTTYTLVWVTDVSDARASGEGTVDGESVALIDLAAD
jgi:hypothetical protein